MFFLLVATNLAIYLSSLQFLGSGNAALAGVTFAGGVLTSSLSVMFYKLKKVKKVGKIGKKLIPDCDCDCLECDCLPDCDGPDCDCDCGD